MKLPRPLNGKTKVELKKPDTDTILTVYEKSEQGKIFSAMLSILESGIESLDGEPPESLKEMPIVSAEVCVTEIFKLYNIQTKVENIYNCPRCGSIVKHEESEDGDTRDDIGNLKIKYSGESDPYVLELSKENRVKIYSNDKVVAEISSMSFRDPTIEDLMKLQNDHTQKSSFRSLKKLYLGCLVDLDGQVSDQDISPDVDSMKNKYMYELLNFPDVRDFNRITSMMRTFGYDMQIKLGCPSCQKQWIGKPEWTGFFAYALRSTVISEGK